MKILLAVDGSESTRKVLDRVGAHRALFDAAHAYTLLNVQAPLPPARPLRPRRHRGARLIRWRPRAIAAARYRSEQMQCQLYTRDACGLSLSPTLMFVT